ncbi:hypothetical protein Tco_0091245 [Tanacetum coccineum]
MVKDGGVGGEWRWCGSGGWYDGDGEGRMRRDGGVDRVDPLLRIIYLSWPESPPENFSGGGGVVVAGIRRWGRGCRK